MLWGVQWYYWVILTVAIIIAIFAWIKALKTSKERRERLKKEAAIWKRDYELRENYSVLTEEKLKSAEETELLHGVAMNIQVMLEKADDIVYYSCARSTIPSCGFFLARDQISKQAPASTMGRLNSCPMVPQVPKK